MPIFIENLFLNGLSDTLAFMRVRPYILVALFLPICSVAQYTIGPTSMERAVVYAFGRKATGGGVITSDLAMYESEYLLAANQSGVLAYDGGSWDLISIPNRGVARSLVEVESGIWVGGQGFIGRLDPNNDWNWDDFSTTAMQVAGDFGDVWHLERAADGKVFASANEFVALMDSLGGFQLLLEGPVTNSFASGSDFYCQRRDSLIVFDAWGQRKEGWGLDAGLRAVALSGGDDALLFTHADGIFRLEGREWREVNTPFSRSLKDARVNALLETDWGWYIATATSGVWAGVDWAGRELIYNEQDGMVGSSVLGLMEDPSGNLWAATEGAINVIRLSWPQRVPQGTQSIQEPGFSSLHLPDGQRYWGTSIDLFTQSSPASDLVPVRGIEGQIWSLQSIDGRPWVSHLNGAGWLDGDRYEPVLSGIGVWEVTAQPETNYHYAGTFEGLVRLDLNGKLPPQVVKGFSETSRFVVFESRDVVWVAYPYKGVYRIHLNNNGTEAKSIRLYNGDHGLPEPVHVEVFDAAGQPIFSTNDGFYRYDASTDRFVSVPDAFSGMIQGSAHVERLYAGPHATWWFVQGQTVGQIHPHTSDLNTSMEVRRIPLSGSPLVAPFERLEILGDHEVCVPVESGFLYLNAARLQEDTPPPALKVHSVQHLNPEDGPAVLDSEHAFLEAGNHVLEIRLRGLDVRWVGVQQYQWRMAGTSIDWSRPQASPRITLGGVGPGDHRVEFRSYIEEGFTGPVTSWSVTVAPNWYERWSVRLLIFGGFMALVAFLVRQKQRRIRAEHAQASAQAESKRIAAEERLKLDLEHSASALEAERLKRIEAEMAVKNQELASATMHLVQKSQMTSTLQSGLQALRERLPHEERKQVDQLLSVLGTSSRLDDNWEQFTQQFDRVHVEFHQRLLDQFPDLTKNDLKLCTYLRMNLSSKEIASLTYVTVRAVEVSRSRLRKRLGLDVSDNLLQFIQSL